MTIPAQQDGWIKYNGDGSTKVFAYNYYFLDPADLVVWTIDTSGNITAPAYGIDFTISGGQDNTGAIHFGTAPAVGILVFIFSKPVDGQPNHFIGTGSLPVETIEQSLDRLTLLAQRLEKRMAQCIKLPEEDTASTTDFPGLPTSRAGKTISFDTNGNVVLASTVLATAYTALLLAAPDAATARAILGVTITSPTTAVTATLANNQSSPANVGSFSLDHTVYRSATVAYDITRKTDTVGSEVREKGLLYLTRKQTTLSNVVQNIFAWVESWITQTGVELNALPTGPNIFSLGFINPATTYVSTSLNMANTGWDFTDSGATMATAIATFKAARPGTTVLAAIGGESFAANWTGFNSTQAGKIAAIVTDFGLDGVDIDFEQSYSVLTDALQENILSLLRTAMPSATICYTGFSVGAYGEVGSPYQNAPPTGSSFTKLAVGPLKWAALQTPNPIDFVNVMAYDVGDPSYSEEQALAAYKYYFSGPVYLGVEVPNEGFGSHVYTIARVQQLAQEIAANGDAGMAIWAIDKPSDVPPNTAPAFLSVIYDAFVSGWDVTAVPVVVDALSGIVFSMNGDNLQYTSDDMSGTNYVGKVSYQILEVTGV